MKSPLEFAERLGISGPVKIAEFYLRPCNSEAGEVPLQEVWGNCDGQDESQDGRSCVPLYGNFRMLGVEESVQLSQDFGETIGNFEYQSYDARIKGGAGWRKGWHPFARHTSDTVSLIIDLDPAPSGNAGQVFLYSPRESLPVKFLGTTLEQFHHAFLEFLKVSNFKTEFGAFECFDFFGVA